MHQTLPSCPRCMVVAYRWPKVVSCHSGKKQCLSIMMYPLIRCYHQGFITPPHCFFILAKGSNAGKPGFTPWVNSFICICPHEEYYKFYYWLIYGLHQSGRFKIYHRGSVIPFINIDDVRHLLKEVAPLIHEDWLRFQEILSSLEKCSKLKTTLQAQVAATEKLQKTLLLQYFQQIKNAPK